MYDFSGYDGTPQTLPPVTRYSIPSYCIFSDGHYPPTYPSHPNPPAPVPLPTNAGRQYKLTPQQLAVLSSHIQLINTQRAPVDVDFAYIADLIREIDQNV